MEFKTEAHQQVYEKTRRELQALFGEVNITTTDGVIALQEGSTFVYVRAFPIGARSAAVEVFSYVAVEVEVTAELMRFLLTYNPRLIFGAFGLSVGDDGRGAVLLSHTILGDTMERGELYASVTAIARIADEMDDRIVGLFGGKTALGRLMAAQPAPAEYWE